MDRLLNRYMVAGLEAIEDATSAGGRKRREKWAMRVGDKTKDMVPRTSKFGAFYCVDYELPSGARTRTSWKRDNCGRDELLYSC